MPFYKQAAIFLHHIHTSECFSCSRDTNRDRDADKYTDRDKKQTGTGNRQGQETDRDRKQTGTGKRRGHGNGQGYGQF
jgi:hypothetical protein